ncbi:G-type lectin S-receptor-like serine/threonine-protein kinase At4g27290 [Camellia sinensis]|uniref:G-type lectin S-receptor-like serine/threonine-protein kinase At4g27290 n=1 Tax=Camellia sinensis TaxID=4442 RepID=UPI001036D76A|nr:G-type lectin S-receptor-like serine/threonine-protein kinase At4g27290 [Camellia sinensis]
MVQCTKKIQTITFDNRGAARLLNGIELENKRCDRQSDKILVKGIKLIENVQLGQDAKEEAVMFHVLFFIISDNSPSDSVLTPDKVFIGVDEGNSKTWIVDPGQFNRFHILKKMRFKLVGGKDKEYIRYGIEIVDWFFPVDLKIPFLFSFLFSILIISNAGDTVTKTQSITGHNTIVSSGGSFEMGFFNPGNSQNTYLGIWYKKISVRTVVWVANREIPLVNSSGILTVIDPGILALVNGTGSVIWSPNVTGSTQDPVAQLMESGNLVVKDVNDNILWQSFDYPCDTLLPGMKLGKNFVTGLEHHLSSWKSSDDPAQGEFTYRCDPQGYPQQILNSGSAELFRAGPWNGIGFSGRPSLKSNSIYTFELVYTKEEVYYDYKLLSSDVSRLTVNHTGVVQRWTWIDRTQQWVIFLTSPTDNCDTYKLCGPNGNCNVGNSPVCDCLSKFVPQNQKEWGHGDWSNGCVRRTPLDCHNGDGFLKYSGYKMPDTRNSWFDRNMTLGECKMVCLKNCSCMAYANLDISSGGSGCLLWFKELIDMRELNANGQDIYIRMASSELDSTVQQVSLNGKKRKIVAVTLAFLIGLFLLGMSLIVYLRKRKRNNSHIRREGMKLGKNFVTGLEHHLSSWKSSDDPAQGEFTYRCDPQGYPQQILNSGSAELFRAGPWNGIGFSGRPSLKSNSIYTFELVYTKEEVYYDYKLLSSDVSRLTVNHTGIAQRWTWIDRTQQWVIFLTSPTDNCDTYKLCGPNGNCNVGNSPVCDCLSKFVPQNQKEWGHGDWSNGCVRRTPLDCHNGDGFLKYSGYKMPDTRNSWFDRNMTLGECKMVCLKNCSCMAYANLDISSGGSGCLLWFKELIDMRELNANGQDIYIRMASSELAFLIPFAIIISKYRRFNSPTSQLEWQEKKDSSSDLGIFNWTFLLGMSLIVYLRKRKRNNSQLRREGNLMHNSEQGHTDKIQMEDLELPLFDLAVIVNSTNNFSINNKLGEGGFGPVYKGMLEGGLEIAVKLLSKNSQQGVDEFKNEVICIAKLQHRNLVKLLGYCVQGEERLLIYEYMANNSLDSFIFDQSKKMLLDWPKRFHIINGIARGLLYLHQDSRFRIIHRDLKASNILLDHEMNPKISDFGLARIFGGNETVANTKRVVGTLGYMSPEYAIEGRFSVKSDIFSFGVMVLEVVSGKRNWGFCDPNHHLNLLGHAWKLYKAGKTTKLIDASMQNSCNLPEVLRSIHVGLLCVQHRPEDRPNMASVVLMLGREGALTHPRQPGFFPERNILEAESERREIEKCSANMVTITLLEAR